MKIHTTQDLNLLNKDYQSTVNFSNQRKYSSDVKPIESMQINASFGKKPPKISDKIVDMISKRATENKSMYEKILSSGSLVKGLHFILENEVLSQAFITFLIGWGLRVPTILSLPEWLGGKHKEDKAYAAAHSGASVSIGLCTAALLTLPLNRGTRYAKDILYKKLKPEILKARHPQLDINSIKDKAGKLLEPKHWKSILEPGDKIAKDFYADVKTPMTMFRPKHVAEIAESTYKSMGIEIDMNANKGKEIYDYVLKDGRKLIDVLNIDDLSIAITEEGMGTTLKGLKDTNFFRLKYIDKNYLEETIPELDMATAFKDGKILHPKNWKKKGSNEPLKLDLYLSNALETSETTPIYTGAKRIEITKAGKEVEKYVAYQRNGIDGGLGTPITNEMLLADSKNDTQDKLIGWAIDIVTRVPVGLLTVSMIPNVLNLFDKWLFNKEETENISESDLNKDKSKELSENDEIEKQENLNSKKMDAAPAFKAKQSNNDISFKGKGKYNFIDKLLAKLYSFKMLNSEKVRDFAENCRKNFNIDMTEVMTIGGSALTSGSYIVGTLTNDKLDKDRRNTLAINQLLGFIAPTFLGVYVNRKIDPVVKDTTYEFIGKQLQNIKILADKGEITKEVASKLEDSAIKAKKGIPVIAKLTVFAMIYRYLTPVAITPLANHIGNTINSIKTKYAAIKEEKANTQLEAA